MATNRPGRVRSSVRFTATFLLAVVLLPWLAGCGSGVGDVSGKVSMKGKSVVVGTVTIIGSDGIPRTGTITADGSYVVKDVAAGDAKILVASAQPATGGGGANKELRGGRDPRKGPDDLPKDAPKIDRPADEPVVVDPELAKKWFPIPDRYTDPMNTPLKVTVRKGPNTHDITIE